MTGVDLLTITGIVVAAVVALCGIARLLPTRRARIQPLPPPGTTPMDLGGLVHPPHDRHVDRVQAGAPTEAISTDEAWASARRMLDGCPCCTGTGERNTCTCRVPCGYGVCQAIDPDPWAKGAPS